MARMKGEPGSGKEGRGKRGELEGKNGGTWKGMRREGVSKRSHFALENMSLMFDLMMTLIIVIVSSTVIIIIVITIIFIKTSQFNAAPQREGSPHI